MSESSVFQNIGNVLSRIDEIKRKYGVNKQVEYPGFDYWLDREMEIKKEEDSVENLRVEKSDEEPAPAQDTLLNKDMDSGNGLSEDTGQNPDMFNNIIREASQRFMIPEQLISAVIKQESNFDQTAVSPKGAMGLMQLMPGTADFLGVDDPFNAEENIFGGTQYLRELINLYNGNLNKALAAYNAGPRRVGEDIPDIPETKDFIQSVLDYYNAFSKYD
jgi:hypothetical protein